MGWHPVNGGAYFAYFDGAEWTATSYGDHTNRDERVVAKGTRNGIIAAFVILFIVIPGVTLALLMLVGLLWSLLFRVS